ncbi:DNA-directed RNA polymerase III subunit RPC3 isoform X2 [Cajanus cajan]|uniref:DNA-directed RNA polymerase III subunit RPC3 isoform X2 n=1 Tax=Cajanus cajan TaxID=3821 RepID=UPI00098D978E|nr:DNA-directed RNA polymerase III subunit RPC3 isoform X2 [Cajanus cajan]
MATQYGIKFAVHLISNHFGNVVSKVCENLFHRGPLTLDQLIHYTELTKEQVKNSLLVLVQHNCAQPFVPDDDDVNNLKVRTQYVALFDNIIHRLRFPKFLETVSQRLDEECAELLDGLLRDGRLTLKQMVDRASQGKENAVDSKVVRELLCKLLTARFVERCPAPEPVVSTSFKETTIRKRGAKSAKIFVAPKTLEQCVLEAAVPRDAIRFSLTADMGLNVDEEKNSDDAQMNSVEENVEEEQILWRANFEEFIRHLRHKVLIENVRTQHDDGTAVVLRAVLEATKTVEKKVKMQNSVPLSLDTITTEVMKTDIGRAFTIDRIRASLSQLGCSGSSIIDDSYSIDLKKIIEQARNEEVESIMLKRYGKDAYRMFRLLSKDSSFLDTDKIAACTLVEPKKASKFLHQLWNDNYLHKETVTGVMVGKPSNIFLWKVNQPLLWINVLDEMYHAALNLSIRMAYEQEKNEELLNVPKDKLKEPGPLQKKYKRLQNVWLLLGASLMKLDDALMLFHDF